MEAQDKVEMVQIYRSEKMHELLNISCRSVVSIALIKHGGPQNLIKIMQPKASKRLRHQSTQARLEEVHQLIKSSLQSQVPLYSLATMPASVRRHVDHYIRTGKGKELLQFGIVSMVAYESLIADLPEAKRSEVASPKLLNCAVKPTCRSVAMRTINKSAQDAQLTMETRLQ